MQLNFTVTEKSVGNTWLSVDAQPLTNLQLYCAPMNSNHRENVCVWHTKVYYACMKQSRLLSDLIHFSKFGLFMSLNTVGVFPVDIDLTNHSPGVYSLEITAIDIFNLSDRHVISYTSKKLSLAYHSAWYFQTNCSDCKANQPATCFMLSRLTHKL